MLRAAAECWAITDEAAGNQRQALALAGALGLPVRHLVLEPRAPWSWLAPRLLAGGRLALPPAQRELFAPPWPRVAVGCGRAAALFTRLLRPLSGGACHTVQILDPRIDPAHWGTVVAPRHDGLHGANVLTPLGSLHPIDEAWLADARQAFAWLESLPRPRTGVLLGGPRKGIALDARYAEALERRLRTLHQRDGGSLMVVASRRTPAALSELLRGQLDGIPGVFWRDAADGPNPYPGVLGWADRLVVTPDSVNMLSEACGVGCPVETVLTAPLPPRIARFHHALREAGYLRGEDTTAVAPPPLRETAMLAAQVRQRMAIAPDTQP
ncbi:mitochondrial fission ELM1 family protein [Dyella sp.]|uniref:mitochondrial fission ELM1 family protein n=1 Tax=Dyella sp. TaxID=1869338 RepID=UPI003F804BCD